MLDDVLAAFVDTVTEREFDEPFIALLRSRGLRDIHFLHGSFEFGKDFIAKGERDGVTCQYAFQTKAGNLNQAAWREVRLQIDDMRMHSRAHPAFDPGLPRIVVLVATGRLVGGASIGAQEYHEYISKREDETFVVWDREDLVTMLSNDPEVGLAGSSAALLPLLGRIDEGSVADADLETYTRRWIGCRGDQQLLARAALEAAVIVNRLRRADRIDLACYAYLWLLRGCWASVHGDVSPPGYVKDLARGARSGFRHLASQLASQLDWALDPRTVLDAHSDDFMLFLTYPARCMRTAELVGLLGLLEASEGKGEWPETASRLKDFVNAQPGTARPISDRWASAMVPPVLLLEAWEPGSASAMLLAAVKWVCDHYEDGLGLANPYAAPHQELSYIVGASLEHVNVGRRSESYIATVLMDLAVAVSDEGCYGAALHEFLAVDVLPLVPEFDDIAGQYRIDGDGLAFDHNVRYREDWVAGAAEPPAPTYSRQPISLFLARMDLEWDHLAITTVLRDRHSPNIMKALVERVRGLRNPSY